MPKSSSAELVTLQNRMLQKEDSNGMKSCSYANYDSCIYSAITRHMKNQTPSEGGCTVPWVIGSDGKGPENICKSTKNVNLTYWIGYNRLTNQFNDCSSPCESLLVTLGAKNLKVYMEPGKSFIKL